MSVTVSDLLLLPSLREAQVLGGKGGLSKIVSSISVLESADPGLLIDDMFPTDEFFGSEIVITGFLNMQNDVKLQLSNMQKLADGGEIGMILYYVGICVPEVDKSLIELADQRDFVLICMPRNRRDLRYGEVLCDVWECIFRDRMQNDSLVSEILDRVSRLPEHQRSVDTVLKMLSDRVSASMVLIDSSHRIINLIAWPRSLEAQLKAEMETYNFHPSAKNSASCPFFPKAQMFRHSILPDYGTGMEFILIKEGTPLGSELWKQVTDVVGLSINIWGKQHGAVAIGELMRAILQDEPTKMRRLAHIFQIDVASIHEMWILQGEKKSSKALLESKSNRIKQMLQDISNVVITGMQESKLIFFFETPASLGDERRLIGEIMTHTLEADDTITLTSCSCLKDTADVRKANLCHKAALADTRTIFPCRRYYTLREVEFAAECRAVMEQGEDSIAGCLHWIFNLQRDKEHIDLLSTLTTYLLDCDSSVTRTSERLYLHKNTVKYRILRISEILGCRPDKMPESIKLYQAAAIYRLVHERKEH